MINDHGARELIVGDVAYLSAGTRALLASHSTLELSFRPPLNIPSPLPTTITRILFNFRGGHGAVVIAQGWFNTLLKAAGIPSTDGGRRLDQQRLCLFFNRPCASVLSLSFPTEVVLQNKNQEVQLQFLCWGTANHTHPQDNDRLWQWLS
jgi:hypothetical protein